MVVDTNKTLTITLPDGQIEGRENISIYDQQFYSFEGIPYAKPPIGELRFRSPQPVESWQGVRECFQCATKPIQKNIITGNVEGSEDCLYLNVYVKNLNSEKPLPVMVYIYGGGFYMGEASRNIYAPDYFMSEDIILVTLNYRLCSLGFLSLADPELQVPGNAGLKDQIFALKWVKRNISLFNGDANNITLFGESAGGASTHYLSVTEQTRDLFHKSIPMSGCILNSWANIPQEDMAYRLAKFHGYDNENNDKKVLAYLRTLEPNKLVVHNLLNEDEIKKGVLFSFAPTTEPYIGDDCVVPKPPIEMIKTAWSNNIPIMHGGTSFEGLLMYPRFKFSPLNIELLTQKPELALPTEIRKNLPEANASELGHQLLSIHLNGKELNSDNLMKVLDLYSYKIFWHGFHRTIVARLKYATTAPTYLYRFDFDSPTFNHYRRKFCGDDPIRGVAHADDLSYLFYGREVWKLSTDSAEYKTIKRMIGTWTAFAKTSNPNNIELGNILWQPLTKENPFKALNISDDVTIIDLPEKSKLEFWNSLYRSEDLY